MKLGLADNGRSAGDGELSKLYTLNWRKIQQKLKNIFDFDSRENFYTCTWILGLKNIENIRVADEKISVGSREKRLKTIDRIMW